MKTTELKALTGEKTRLSAINSLYSRLQKRQWTIAKKEYALAGIDGKTLDVHFTRTESLPEGGCWHNRATVPLDTCIDCISGNL